MEILQITTSSPADSLSISAGQDSMALINLIFQGGYMMIPIFLLSFVAVYVYVERIRTISRAAKTPPGFMDNIKKLVNGGGRLMFYYMMESKQVMTDGHCLM
jgi:biopolymer transport protein ExbB